jgi:hypothetical protein
MADEIVDHDARGMAVTALQAIQSHERLCIERAKNADLQRDRMEAKLDRLFSAQERQLYIVIMFLVAALGFFLVPFFRLHV